MGGLGLPGSAEPARDVGLGLRIGGLGEDVAGVAEFDQAAQVEERGPVRAARRLLHVVGDDHDGVASRATAGSAPRSWRWRCGSRAEQGSSMSSTSGCTASARAMQRRCCCPPERLDAGPVEDGPSPRPTGPPCAGTPRAAAAGTPGRARRSGAARRGRSPRSTWSETGWISGTPCRPGGGPAAGSTPGAVEILAEEPQRALDAGARRQLVHPVERAQEGRLAAAARPDDRGHLLRRDAGS